MLAVNQRITGQYFAENMGGVWLMTTDEYAKASRWKRLGYAAVRHPLIILLGYITIFVYGLCLHQVMTRPWRHLDSGVALLLHAALITGLAVYAPAALVFTFLAPILLAAGLGADLFYAQHNEPGARFPRIWSILGFPNRTRGHETQKQKNCRLARWNAYTYKRLTVTPLGDLIGFAES